MQGQDSTLTKTIEKPSIASTVLNRITEAIVKREIKPGELLPSEAALSENMGVGKSSVREAVKMLNILGIVETVQGEGTFVRESVDKAGINPLVYQMILSQGGSDEIFELRQMFEPAYTLLAMQKATEEDLAAIRHAVTHLEERVRRGEQTAKDDLAFHEAILQATHNRYVAKIGHTMLQLYEASISSSMVKIPERAVADHKRIYQAFVAKSEEALLEAVYESFEGWATMLRNRN
ncbi:MAG: FadR family transcriptional regulator [Clostridia bacterium]|nr:FadR family transcriptional regulator [Clostridia bacterium]